jgi:CheY-like chemotaxis protein
MNYLQIVQDNVILFSQVADADGIFFKLAYDLAKILENPIFQTDADKKNDYEMDQIVEAREAVFHDFCTACTTAGVEVPELEPIFYQAYLPKRKKEDEKNIAEAESMSRYVGEQFQKVDVRGETETTGTIEAMIKILQLFPGCGDWNGIKRKNIMAVINSRLVRLGCLPIRPDYGNRAIDYTTYLPAGKLLKVLIVDDDVRELLNTARAFIGWGNIEIEFLRYQAEDRKVNRKLETQKVAQEIIDRKPDIVLMDQGLAILNGSQVIVEFKSITQDWPVFIANTGGGPEELNAVGAIGNCVKGRDMVDVRRIVERLGNSR